MKVLRNDHGSVLVFITLMVVLLMVMVGMGLDTGQLGYTRSTGQPAVDASALAAVSALPLRDIAKIQSRATAFNSKNTFTKLRMSSLRPSWLVDLFKESAIPINIW